ncbi:hypothetical protein GQ42DRAFT_83449 [Ramicandelaber brevisporus]|nr:hypothetical protein GQ42DRAFT_83449 [Ramicandelaber brevisporus]
MEWLFIDRLSAEYAVSMAISPSTPPRVPLLNLALKCAADLIESTQVSRVTILAPKSADITAEFDELLDELHQYNSGNHNGNGNGNHNDNVQLPSFVDSVVLSKIEFVHVQSSMQLRAHLASSLASSLSKGTAEPAAAIIYRASELLSGLAFPQMSTFLSVLCRQSTSPIYLVDASSDHVTAEMHCLYEAMSDSLEAYRSS